jgi:Fe2+ transport system protein B
MKKTVIVVGQPGVGKSTIINAFTNSNAKIGYGFKHGTL